MDEEFISCLKDGKKSKLAMAIAVIDALIHFVIEINVFHRWIPNNFAVCHTDLYCVFTNFAFYFLSYILELFYYEGTRQTNCSKCFFLLTNSLIIVTLCVFVSPIQVTLIYFGCKINTRNVKSHVRRNFLRPLTVQSQLVIQI